MMVTKNSQKYFYMYARTQVEILEEESRAANLTEEYQL